jgi:sugar transferase (PEP-CTERM/EpsH1 system associated)
MENGVVNLLNQMSGSLRHAIACIEGYTDFRWRLQRTDVEVIALDRSNVGVWRMRRDIYRLCRRLRPAILHTRNLSSLDAIVPAKAAGVGRFIHGEHGWDVDNLGGHRVKPALLRRLHAPLVDRYVAVSRHLERYLIERIGVDAGRITRICNGVDVERFNPVGNGVISNLDGNHPFSKKALFGDDAFVIGTVGRAQQVKDQATLIHGFAEVVRAHPQLRKRLRLAIIGDGPLLADLRELARATGVADVAWLPGALDNVSDVLRTFDLFVLPSLNEGISNTILEAMASGLPVVATRAGGNAEIVSDGCWGRLFEPGDIPGLATLLSDYASNGEIRAAHANAARRAACEHFSLDTMIARYVSLYETLLGREWLRDAA